MATSVNGEMASRRKRSHRDAPFVNEEFKIILEEFLKKREYRSNRTRSELPPKSSLLRHQKIVEIDVTEKTNSYNRSDSYQQASLESILDEEESDNGLSRRSKTMPSGFRSELAIKSKEITGREDSELLDGKHPKGRRKSNKEKDKAKKERGNSKRKVSVCERPDKIPPAPTRGEADSQQGTRKHNSHPSRISTISQTSKPGSESSENTDTDSLVSTGRKKKNFMTRTKERLSLLLKKDKEKKDKNECYDDDEDDCFEDKNVQKEKRKLKKKSKPKPNRAEIITEVHKHGKAHIKQSTDSGNHVVLRTGEKWEEIDIDVNGKKKHIEQHIKLKESTDDGKDSSKTLLDSIKRMRPFSRRHSKKSITESKSAELHPSPSTDKKDYDRSVSVPNAGKDRIHVKYENKESFPNEDKVTTHVFDEIVDDKKFVEIESFDEFSSKDGIHTYLPKDASFEMDIDYDVNEKYLKLPDGRVRKISASEETRKRVDDVPDHPTDTKKSDSPKKALTEEEKEKIYEKIAEKLAEIGDSYVQQLESEVDAVDSPVSASEPTPISSQEFTGSVDERLNSLEQKLVFHLRGTGDKLAEEISFPEDAAKEIVKDVTYNKFKSTVKEAVGESVGQYQLAMFLHLTKSAVHLAGTGGAVAAHIKEMSLRYFEDKFASWIVNQGGWESVLEDDDSELD